MKQVRPLLRFKFNSSNMDERYANQTFNATIGRFEKNSNQWIPDHKGDTLIIFVEWEGWQPMFYDCRGWGDLYFPTNE